MSTTPNGRPVVEAVLGERAVALLEDVQRDDDPGAQDRVEREERDIHHRRPGRTRRADVTVRLS